MSNPHETAPGNNNNGVTAQSTGLSPALRAQTVPDGWALVPVAPTFEMLDAVSVQGSRIGRSFSYPEGVVSAEAYREMLRRAPEPPPSLESGNETRASIGECRETKSATAVAVNTNTPDTK